MRPYGDQLFKYPPPHRPQHNHRIHFSRTKAVQFIENKKNSQITFTSTLPYSNNHNKENVMANCNSNINLILTGQNSTNQHHNKSSTTAKQRSSSFLNKSQAIYTGLYAPSNLNKDRYKVKSKWQTTQYHQNQNYDPSTQYEFVTSKDQISNNNYSHTISKYLASPSKQLFSNNRNQDTYPKFGNQTKQLKQQTNRTSRSKKTIPLYQRLKGYNETGFYNQNENYLQKRYAHNTDYSQLYTPKKQTHDTLSALKQKQIIDKYQVKSSFIDFFSTKLKTQPSKFEITKKTSLKFDQGTQPQLNDFLIGQCKGQGRFGKVFIAIHKKTGFLCALKKIKKQSVKYMIEQFIQQVKIQLYLNHSKLLKIYGFFSDKQYFYMLIQYMEQGSLYSLMKKNKKFQEKEAAQKLSQICEGIKQMHSRNIVHRDLKPENVVMSNGVCKICDFGWATICQDRRQTYCGTLDYVCPQIVQGNAYDSSADIWCIGVLAYQLMCGKAPFYDISRQKTIQNIKSCKIDSYPLHLSRKAIKFIQMILKKNPDSRVGIQKLLDSQFIRQVRK